MFEWLFRRHEDEIGDNIDRWGCLGVLLLGLIGAGLVFIAVYVMQDSELVWRLVVGGLGFLIFGFGVGFRWLFGFYMWP